MSNSNIINRIIANIPSFNCSNPKFNQGIRWIGRNISSAENKLILGATALATQPFIDLNNKKVDKKTREISCYRTISRIIAGTLTGVLIRKGFINLVKNNSVLEKEVNNTFKRFFTPPDVTISDHAYKQYQNALGTFLAILTMVFTNFAIDAPLTKYLTNRLSKHTLKKDEKEALNGKL